MEKEIKYVCTSLRSGYYMFWIIPVLMIVIGETANEWTGLLAAEVKTTYLLETTVILLTAICVPVALKLFARVLVKQIDQASITRALKLYHFWSIIRLLILALPMVVGMFTYYMSLSMKGLLCALIALTASLFCFPSEKRLRSELRIYNEENSAE
ncbi:MAG: hypothetical protein J6C87_06800 [Bacteroides sp.]|nr:hypothetical protein [Bacteroides sp.]